MRHVLSSDIYISGWPADLELSGNFAALEMNQRISQKWQKSGKSQSISNMWHKCCRNFFQHGFNFIFVEQFLSHFVLFIS